MGFLILCNSRLRLWLAAATFDGPVLSLYVVDPHSPSRGRQCCCTHHPIISHDGPPGGDKTPPRIALVRMHILCAGAPIKAGSQLPLEELLAVFLAEASPLLRPGYLKLDDIARWGGLSGPPSRAALLLMLQTRYGIPRAQQ